jgi:hypothetical protein
MVESGISAERQTNLNLSTDTLSRPIPVGTERYMLNRDGLAPPYTRPFCLNVLMLNGIFIFTP